MRQRKEEARWSDYFAFVPVVLCVAVALYLPSPADRKDVENVRATLSQAIEMITSLWRSESPSLQVADAGPSAMEQGSSSASSSYNSPKQWGGSTRQLWENRPVREDYANGPTTRISYGQPPQGISPRNPR